ncbi:unnamed protein product [Amoebophrya sp. A25]|nr:unnamed protein product [Amoebophrya sp. A25]|eukprot:GSA25T00009492001.1
MRYLCAYEWIRGGPSSNILSFLLPQRRYLKARCTIPAQLRRVLLKEAPSEARVAAGIQQHRTGSTSTSFPFKNEDATTPSTTVGDAAVVGVSAHPTRTSTSNTTRSTASIYRHDEDSDSTSSGPLRSITRQGFISRSFYDRDFEDYTGEQENGDSRIEDENFDVVDEVDEVEDEASSGHQLTHAEISFIREATSRFVRTSTSTAVQAPLGADDVIGRLLSSAKNREENEPSLRSLYALPEPQAQRSLRVKAFRLLAERLRESEQERQLLQHVKERLIAQRKETASIFGKRKNDTSSYKPKRSSVAEYRVFASTWQQIEKTEAEIVDFSKDLVWGNRTTRGRTYVRVTGDIDAVQAIAFIRTADNKVLEAAPIDVALSNLLARILDEEHQKDRDLFYRLHVTWGVTEPSGTRRIVLATHAETQDQWRNATDTVVNVNTLVQSDSQLRELHDAAQTVLEHDSLVQKRDRLTRELREKQRRFDELAEQSRRLEILLEEARNTSAYLTTKLQQDSLKFQKKTTPVVKRTGNLRRVQPPRAASISRTSSSSSNLRGSTQPRLQRTGAAANYRYSTSTRSNNDPLELFYSTPEDYDSEGTKPLFSTGTFDSCIDLLRRVLDAVFFLLELSLDVTVFFCGLAKRFFDNCIFFPIVVLLYFGFLGLHCVASSFFQATFVLSSLFLPSVSDPFSIEIGIAQRYGAILDYLESALLLVIYFFCIFLPTACWVERRYSRLPLLLQLVLVLYLAFWCAGTLTIYTLRAMLVSG